MSLDFIEGPIAVVQQSSETFGYVSGNRRSVQGGVGSVSTQSFRINGKPILLKLSTAVSLTTDDVVAVAGKDKNGVLDARAFYNRTTGAYSSKPIALNRVFGILLILIGIPTSLFVFGLVFIGVGIFLLMEASKNRAAEELVKPNVSPGSG